MISLLREVPGSRIIACPRPHPPSPKTSCALRELHEARLSQIPGTNQDFSETQGFGSLCPLSLSPTYRPGVQEGHEAP